jgi:hypothetical protein
LFTMPEFDFTVHARDMLTERNIPEDWVWRALNQPDETHMGEDGYMHYTKAIQERDGRILHVVVNPTIQPNRIVTLFFDHRLMRTK